MWQWYGQGMRKRGGGNLFRDIMTNHINKRNSDYPNNIMRYYPNTIMRFGLSGFFRDKYNQRTKQGEFAYK